MAATKMGEDSKCHCKQWKCVSVKYISGDCSGKYISGGCSGKYRVFFFFTGTPLKVPSTKKVNLG